MNDSIIENIILTGFPIDNLASLNEVEKKLKNDNVFYKQLVSFFFLIGFLCNAQFIVKFQNSKY